jgi:hypothetical protein
VARRVFAPKTLVLRGLLVMATGIVSALRGNTCLVQRDRINGMDVAASVAQCSGYNVAAGAGFVVLIAGAAIVLLAALAHTPRWSKRLPAQWSSSN